jgi:hypothetical protein
MDGFQILATNFLSPLVLAFLLGVFAKIVKSEISLPDGVLKFMSIYLLLSIGLKGGYELAQVSLSEITNILVLTVILIFLIPCLCFFLVRKLGGFDVPNAAALAAHYGSVSSVTFFTALTFAKEMGNPAEGYMPAIVALMEWGVVVSLLIARIFTPTKPDQTGNQSGTLKDIVIDTLRGRGIILLSGGMLIGYFTGDAGYQQVAPFYDDLFRGILMLFLLEMGMTAAGQFKEFKKVGWFMIAFGTIYPLVIGIIGVGLGNLVGMSVGGAFVFGAILASASYIDAPAACRAALPTANPGIYLTASLGITFPFNLLVGLPIFYKVSLFLQ